MREMLANHLRSSVGCEVVAECSGADGAVSLWIQHAPELVILDPYLRQVTGAELVQLIRRSSKARILLFTESSRELPIRSAMREGVHGFVDKRSPLQTVVQAIQLVATGGSYFTPEVAHLTPTTGTAPERQVTSREREIWKLVAEGFRTKEIADVLGVSSKTVANHRHALMRKLQVHDVATLTRVALREGLTESEV
jgi:DNA-binding NarL/FixJ family response regulator